MSAVGLQSVLIRAHDADRAWSGDAAAQWHLPKAAQLPAAMAPAAIDMVIAAGRGRRRAATVVEAIALTALVPFGVLAVAAPFLLAVWALGALSAWWTGG